MNLKETDYKLLSYLYHNYDEPLSKIAKNTKLSRDQVGYRINKYLKEGLIRKFSPVFDWSKLGYDVFIILLLKFEKSKMAEDFSKDLNKSKNCMSYGKVYGKYDLYLNCIFKDEKELNEFISKLFENENQFIIDYILIKPQFIELYPLKFFYDINKEDYEIISSDSKNEIKLDKTDLKILKILSENGRTKLIDIAIKSKISSVLALYRLKKLKKEKIIFGNRIQFNMSSLGYFFTLILIDFRNFSKKNKEKIKYFAKNSKDTNSLIFNLQKPNCIIQLFHKEEGELRDNVEKIKELFKEECIEINVLQIGEDLEKVRPLPFIH
ncbi:MAG: winged helix-turn-helix transcriptional regulator [Nanoarchaeota archaeon]|nr:winged helix-turn-helix transcriptional regulator [Nanoarchaeota archaeon]MBU1321744.1 winged helix-turn-helix transcriptional regulator [Nanoarchaeota archaeon]MBU1597468.1 winged helix-turn-helix transcriptional regulator [Nanoarchaeota archaeon]MBU2441406.1 winged helix-turn-helix transcriptional regulator [Nanoarchaeota archaeon]